MLIAVLNWAAKSRDEQGRLLLDRNPLKDLRTPTEKNPNRVVLAEEEYHALLNASRTVDWRFRVALVLAHETGHRIGAIRQLRWLDIDFDGGTILWRAEHDKSGYEHITPVTDEALDALKEVRAMNPGTGDAPVLPAPKNPRAAVGAARLHAWWSKAQILAGLEPKPGRGWHSLRRKFASDLMDQPLKVLCQLGGWKTAKTVLRRYRQQDVTTPYERFKALPGAEAFLRPGVTLGALDQLAAATTDLDAAQAVQRARDELFRAIGQASNSAA